MDSKKIKKQRVVFSTVSLLFVFSLVFFFDVHPADADVVDVIVDQIGSGLLWALNVLLYSMFVIVSFPMTWAAMLFGLTVDPVAVNTMFKMPAIYTLWQMVRDFFNLFFILTLLFIAFATIFQIDSFNYKKTLGKLLLMALLVNFSFPIARFVVDIANVPMYFFMESMFKDKSAAKAQDVANVAFGTSNLEAAIFGKDWKGYASIDGDWGLTVKIIIGIIFMFLFGVSLLVLAILFLIRSLALVILVIFSSVGFAGMVIPGFRSYASKWWDNLLKYAFFGPAAMLMMLVSIKFLEGFNAGMGSPAAIASKSSSAGGGTYLASMVATMAPIVLIWMSITIGQTMGIQGAGVVTANAQKFSKWAGRKSAGGVFRAGTLGQGPAAVKGAQAGWKNFAQTGKFMGVAVPGAQPFTKNATEAREAKYAGFFKGGRKGYVNAEKELARKRTYERADELKKGNVGNSELLKQIGAENRKADGSFKDPVGSGAAAMVLADRKAITGAENFVNALQALGDNTKEISTLIEKAGGDALKLDAKQYGAAIASFDTKTLADTGENAVLKKSLDGKLRKEGKSKVLVDYQVSRRAEGIGEAEAYQAAYTEVLGKMGATDIAKQGDIFDDSHFIAYAEKRAAASPKWAQSVMEELVKSPTNAQHEGKWAGVLLKSKTSPENERKIITDTNIAAAKQTRDAGNQNKTA